MSTNKIYKPYCFKCYCVLNPDREIKRRYKTKGKFISRSFERNEFRSENELEFLIFFGILFVNKQKIPNIRNVGDFLVKCVFTCWTIFISCKPFIYTIYMKYMSTY
jgi:hypothetical protein